MRTMASSLAPPSASAARACLIKTSCGAPSSASDSSGELSDVLRIATQHACKASSCSARSDPTMQEDTVLVHQTCVRHTGTAQGRHRGACIRTRTRRLEATHTQAHLASGPPSVSAARLTCTASTHHCPLSRAFQNGTAATHGCAQAHQPALPPRPAGTASTTPGTQGAVRR